MAPQPHFDALRPYFRPAMFGRIDVVLCLMHPKKPLYILKIVLELIHGESRT